MNKLAELLKQSRICHEFLPEMGRKLQLDAGLFRLVHNVRGIRSPKPIARHFHRRQGHFGFALATRMASANGRSNK